MKVLFGMNLGEARLLLNLLQDKADEEISNGNENGSYYHMWGRLDDVIEDTLEK